MELIFSILVIFILGCNYAYAQDVVPTRPPIPTIESCRMYRQALYEQRVAIYKRKQLCMRNGNMTGPYPKRQICSLGPPPHLVTQGTPYPDCYSEDETLCDSQMATEVDVEKCFLEAKGNNEDKADAKRVTWFNEKAAEYNNIEKKYNELSSAIGNPGKFFIEKVTPRLPKIMVEQLDIYKNDIKSALPENLKLHPLELLRRDKNGSLATLYIFDENKEFSQRGEKLNQEVYDFLFNKSAGNRDLYNDNPVIKEIQGTAAKELRKIQISILTQLDMLPQKMEQVTQQMSQYSQKNIPVSASASSRGNKATNHNTSNIDCSVLDGPERTDISVNTPEVFEELLEKCSNIESK